MDEGFLFFARFSVTQICMLKNKEVIRRHFSLTAHYYNIPYIIRLRKYNLSNDFQYDILSYVLWKESEKN